MKPRGNADLKGKPVNNAKIDHGGLVALGKKYIFFAAGCTPCGFATLLLLFVAITHLERRSDGLATKHFRDRLWIGDLGGKPFSSKGNGT